jgi:hypothetical protein
VCPGWSVNDVALHLLGDDIDLLSRRRDGAAPADTPGKLAGFQELVVALDRLNQSWVEATRRISPRLLRELLAVTGEATERYLVSLELFAVEEPAFLVPVLATFVHALPRAFTDVPAAVGRRWRS